MKHLVVALSLLLAACTAQTSLFEGWGSPPKPVAPKAVVGFVIDNSEAVDGVGEMVFELNMQRPELIYPFITLAMDEGFYNGMPVHRAIPGLVAEAGDGKWKNLENRRLPVNGEKEGDVLWAAKLLAVKVNSDGSVGPGLIFTTGHTTLEHFRMPEGIVIGKLVEGWHVMKKLRKGDTIVRVWAKNIPHPSTLVKKEAK